MSVRAKFRVTSHNVRRWSKDSPSQTTVRLEPVYDETIPEDQRYAKATPSGSIEMTIDNPAALEQLSLGTDFYVDFTPVQQS